MPRTAAQAEAAQEPRAPVEARYKGYEDYRGQFQRALDGLVRGRYVLAEDAPRLMQRCEEEWKWVTKLE